MFSVALCFKMSPYVRRGNIIEHNRYVFNVKIRHDIEYKGI